MTFEIGPNLETLLLAAIVATPGIVAAIFARNAAKTTRDVSTRIDGRLDAVVAGAHAQGVLIGQANPGVDPQELAPLPDPAINNPPKE